VRGAAAPSLRSAGGAPVEARRRAYVSVAGVAKSFHRGKAVTRALSAVDLTLHEGEFVAVVGPSGCGKSTLLRLIAGLIAPSAGSVELDGRKVSAPQTNLGVVFQSPVLLDWRTVLENVLVQLELRGMDPAAYKDRAMQLLGRVGLAEFADRFPRELSGGMRQRTALVRALIHDPPFLLMDEPFGALDALTREQMRLDLEALWMETGKTVLFITHSIDEAVLLADRVIVMSARPGQVEREIPIGMPRPRGLAGRRAPEFMAATNAITEIFLARGILHQEIKTPQQEIGK
jgi:NitT/TauT family transport system ATP-binding protein